MAFGRSGGPESTAERGAARPMDGSPESLGRPLCPRAGQAAGPARWPILSESAHVGQLAPASG
jgi:hypothetical protein